MASNLAIELQHLRDHVKFPAGKSEIVATCNNMMDVPAEDRDWFAKALPEGRYENAGEVMSALLKKA